MKNCPISLVNRDMHIKITEILTQTCKNGKSKTKRKNNEQSDALKGCINVAIVNLTDKQCIYFIQLLLKTLNQSTLVEITKAL